MCIFAHYTKHIFQMQKRIVVGLDCGDTETGIVFIEGTRIDYCDVVPNCDVYGLIKTFIGIDTDIIVVIEDVKPYGVKLRQQLIDTCKFIGQIEYRLKQAEIPFYLIPRATVKAWVFKNGGDDVLSHVKKNVARREKINPSERKRTESFVYIDDRAVIAGMKHHWRIPTPKPGKKNIYGLKSHSWQALAAATVYIETKSPT